MLAAAQFGRSQYQLTATAISSLTIEAKVVLHKRALWQRLCQGHSIFSFLLLLHHPPASVGNRKEFFTASFDADQIAVRNLFRTKIMTISSRYKKSHRLSELDQSKFKELQINGCSLLRPIIQGSTVHLEPTCSVLVECDGRDIRSRRGRSVMSKALVLGTAALILSAAGASAQVYTTPGYGYAEPVADLALPADGYAAPALPPAYTAPPIYAAPVYTPPTVYVVPAPVYAAPLPAPVYATPLPAPVYGAPVVSRPIYAYAPGYWGGYGHGWRGYGHRW